MRGMAAVPSACASSLVAVIAAVFVILLQGCADFEQIEQAVTGDSNATAALPSPTPSLSPTPTPLSSTSPIPTSSSAQSPTTTTSQVSKAISLSLIHWGGGPRLVVDLAPAARRPAGSDGSSSSSSSSSSSWLASQKFVLDTGSSTLAFCSNGNTLMNQAAYSLTNYISCNKYNPGGQSTGYWGPFVHGLLRMGAGTSITLEAEYSIMAEEAIRRGLLEWRSPTVGSWHCWVMPHADCGKHHASAVAEAAVRGWLREGRHLLVRTDWS
eukprot:TRINITY_DN13559_c0_g1_i2.p2 TRINITY_DN13559_c0_g1~~TRINITY_DN13559_c0_g1_i2.p2  ORF type:complete len:268 (+),score=49.99 TRINITY_DN13559_c0_g1_i2:116-919(+)